MKIKKNIGALVKIIIAVVVVSFLGMKSLNFFMFTTPADQWYLSWLGFGLTGGGVLAYLLIFIWDADTELKKTVSLIMLGVCVVGELATAGFGMQVDTWAKTGFELAESDFQAMVFAVQLLGFAHALALIAYVAGDLIGETFGDDDGDGVRNGKDPDYKKGKGKPQPAPMTPNAAEVELAELRETVKQLQAAAAPKEPAGTPKE